MALGFSCVCRGVNFGARPTTWWRTSSGWSTWELMGGIVERHARLDVVAVQSQSVKVRRRILINVQVVCVRIIRVCVAFLLGRMTCGFACRRLRRCRFSTIRELGGFAIIRVELPGPVTSRFAVDKSSGARIGFVPLARLHDSKNKYVARHNRASCCESPGKPQMRCGQTKESRFICSEIVGYMDIV